MCYIYFKQVTINNILCTLLCTRVDGYICLQGFHNETGSIHLSCCGLSVGVGHPQHKFVISAVEI